MHQRRKFILTAAVLSFCAACILTLTRTQSNENSKISLEVGNWGGSGLEQQLRSMRAQLQSRASILQAHSSPNSNEWEQSAAEEWRRGMNLIHDAPMLASRNSFPPPVSSRSSFLVGDADPDSPSFRPPPAPSMTSPALESAIMNAPSPLGISLPQLLSSNPQLLALPAPAQAAAPSPPPPPPAEKTAAAAPGLSSFQTAMLRAMLVGRPGSARAAPPALSAPEGGLAPPAPPAPSELAERPARRAPAPAPALQALAARAGGVLARADDVLARAAAEEEGARAAAARRLRAEEGVLARAARLSAGARGVLDAVRRAARILPPSPPPPSPLPTHPPPATPLPPTPPHPRLLCISPFPAYA
jgi:hypothetical protein